MENWVPNAFDFQVVELLIEEQGKEAILEPDRPLGKFVRPSGFNRTRVIQLSSHPSKLFNLSRNCNNRIAYGLFQKK
ncbi:hypothetical protein QJS10_CPB17g01277 [Acorus calamus]|uniref:Uncharacterized protein n=1 Tax=Acorus calamus TaxID=4465 RepID=A0AAV9CQN9_ACOCL|nr:hypothetical protein QJS10_CPB17g01277 [Acorus calamus]